MKDIKFKHNLYNIYEIRERVSYFGFVSIGHDDVMLREHRSK